MKIIVGLCNNYFLVRVRVHIYFIGSIMLTSHRHTYASSLLINHHIHIHKPIFLQTKSGKDFHSSVFYNVELYRSILDSFSIVFLPIQKIHVHVT